MIKISNLSSKAAKISLILGILNIFAAVIIISRVFKKIECERDTFSFWPCFPGTLELLIGLICTYYCVWGPFIGLIFGLFGLKSSGRKNAIFGVGSSIIVIILIIIYIIIWDSYR